MKVKHYPIKHNGNEVGYIAAVGSVYFASEGSIINGKYQGKGQPFCCTRPTKKEARAEIVKRAIKPSVTYSAKDISKFFNMDLKTVYKIAKENDMIPAKGAFKFKRDQLFVFQRNM